MTHAEYKSLHPLVEDLQKRGILAPYSIVSWQGGGEDYCYGFRVRSPGLREPLLVVQPFTEEEIVRRLALAEARQNHGDAITSTLAQAGDTLVRDLAALYESRLYGREIPIPESVTLKDVFIQFTQPISS